MSKTETLDKGHTNPYVSSDASGRKDRKCNDLIKNVVTSPRRGWTPRRIGRLTSSLAVDLDMEEVAIHRDCLEKDKSNGQTADPFCV
jgi:hypothetical protein